MTSGRKNRVDNPDGEGGDHDSTPRYEFGFRDSRHDDDGSLKPTKVEGEKLTARQNADRWRHRRRMAYMSLIGIFIATLLLFFIVDENRLIVLEEPIVWFYISMASIVGSYVGFATWDNVRGGR